MRVFQQGGLEIKYKVEGTSGPVYVLLHGFGGGPADWSVLANKLSVTNRVVVPNLKVFFSHADFLSFSRQIQFLSEFINELYRRKGVHVLNLMGQSYGATLSLGVRLRGQFNVGQHVLINPMPFHPLVKVRDPQVKKLVQESFAPGGIGSFLRTSDGREALSELARVFRIGALGTHEISHFNDRKMNLVERAFERFYQIDRSEDWTYWEHLLSALPEGAIDRFFYSNEDSLFSKADYAQFAARVKSREVHEIQHKGHLLIQDLKNMDDSETRFEQLYL